MTRRRPIRFAVVGLGHISQVAVLPAFDHAPDAEVVALVSSTPEKLDVLGDRHDVPHRVGYDGYDELLRSGEVDAVYIALPNDQHCEFTERAARAGVHVLCEKPMARTEDECHRMIRACEDAGVQLMIAYRLHFEETNMKVVEAVQAGRIGTPRVFQAVFSLLVKEGDIRIDRRRGGGPLFDIGIYCVNAARYVFREEPVRVTAFTARGDDPRFCDVEESAAAVLEFPGGKLASITTSFGGASVDEYRVVGTRGDIRVEPAFGYADELAFELTVEGETERAAFAKRDQFAPELIRFAQHIREGTHPEPDGYEGLADVRIIQAARRSAAEGRPIDLVPVDAGRRPSLFQEIHVEPVDEPPPEIQETGPRAG